LLLKLPLCQTSQMLKRKPMPKLLEAAEKQN
jgi:hypothetical protein